MTNKRTQFLSRLLRISQLNEQLMEITDKNSKQPAYAKKIKLVQMNPCNINFQEPRNASCNPQKSTGKVMIINRPNLNFNLISSYRSETILVQEDLLKSHISPLRMYENHQIKGAADRKRASMNVEVKSEEVEMQMSNSVACEGRYPVTRNQDIYRQRLKYKEGSLGKRNYYERKGEQSTKVMIPQQSTFNAEVVCIPVKSISNIETKKDSSVQSKTEKEPKYFRSLNHIAQFSNNQKQIEQQKKAKLSLMKEINKNYAKPFNPPPKITAKSYIICQTKDNQQNLRVVVSYNSKNSQEVASLTKIMTCILTIQFCQNNNFNIHEEEVKIGRFQSLIGGTSAQLEQGQVYTIIQLLYGLMLPSGNDASLALAVWCGKRFIQLDKAKNEGDQLSTANSSIFGQRLVKSDCYSRFIKEMNAKAHSLKMNKTQYANSHGLINVNNKSTAYDIAVLSAYAMKNEVFREIVSCKSYKCTIKYYGEKLEELKEEHEEISNTEPDEECQEIGGKSPSSKAERKTKVQNTSRPATARADTRSLISRAKYSQTPPPSPSQITVQWENTHKLLHSKPREYLGIKTGITTNAGPCLSSCILIQDRKFLIVVLNCGKVNLRFKETQILKKWLYKHEGIVRTVKKTSELKLTKSIKSINNEIEAEESQADSCLASDDRD